MDKFSYNKIINDYSIDKDLFVKRYAFGVIEHYIHLVNNENVKLSSNYFYKIFENKILKSKNFFCYSLILKGVS